MEENPETVFGNFADGSLTHGEFREMVKKIKSNRDYLNGRSYEALLQLADQKGVDALTKYQYVQCYEKSLFDATGVTRA